MTNSEIAASFGLLAKLMELHQENPFKIRSYKRVASFLGKLDTPLADCTTEQLLELEGVGKAIADKIQQLTATGAMATLDRFKEQTPAGIQEMLLIRGLGPGKIRTVWQEIGVENAIDLIYACQENRLIELKGFGTKTQADVLQKLQFYLENQGSSLYPHVVSEAQDFLELMRSLPGIERAEETGELRRKLPVIDLLDILVQGDAASVLNTLSDHAEVEPNEGVDGQGTWRSRIAYRISFCTAEQFEYQWLVSTGPDSLIESLQISQEGSSEKEILEANGLPFIPPIARDLATKDQAPPARLIQREDVRGMIHVHSAYSDGVDTVAQLGDHAAGLGYEYLGLTDHSGIAVFAHGLSPERVVEQWAEIDRYNEGGKIRVLKGIECDILSNGDLDYDDDFRAQFEFVIASVHTNLKMDEATATARVVRAIENPSTNILGHPTGRLLLGRSGYPLDMSQIFDACAANQVAIELNASPYRLDLDWQWIREAVDRGIQICINPDAHARAAMKYVDYGVSVAQKGWLNAESCLNSCGVEDFLNFCKKG